MGQEWGHGVREDDAATECLVCYGGIDKEVSHIHALIGQTAQLSMSCHYCTIYHLQVNYELFKNFTVVATSGPTHQELPPFKWSDTEWARPKGHPDEFKFQPVFNWLAFDV